MSRVISALLAMLVLASCGGGSRGTPSATGEISQACMAGGRSAANRQLCSCVQAAANQTLSSRDQTRAAEFFGDPDKAQDTRTADGPAAEAFWARYRNFVSTAEAMCRS